MAITGVIRPPPEIRAVADRTASYVAKNGRTFEARILNSAKGKTPKFAFLQPTSPFHAYYEDRIRFYENGGDDNEEKKAEEAANDKQEKAGTPAAPTTTGAPTKETIRKTEKTQVASAIDPIAKALLAQRSKISQAKESTEGAEETEETTSTRVIPPPPLDLVTIVPPANLSLSQLEVIQLVAQFAALDGKGGTFLHQLSLREWSNSEFSFCQPRHAHFAYFSALVDAYRKIITDWTAAASEKSDNKEKSNNAEATKSNVQVALEDAAYRAEYERYRAQQKSQQQEEGEVVAIDWHDFVVVETIDFPVDEKVELGMLPPPPPPPTAVEARPATATRDTMDESDEEEEEAIRVVPSYTPKVVGTANPQAARAIDPITGKSVPVADLPEHLRIQLLDPKWAEERKKFQDKQKESNLVAGDAIVSNLSRYSQARGDLFGKSEQELLDKEKDSKRRLEEANRIIREQANNPSPAFPPPPPGVPPGLAPHSMEPAAKRARMDGYSGGVNTSGIVIPPPPPPPPTQIAVAPPPPPPQAGGMEPSGNPLADAILLANNNEFESSGKQLMPEAEFVASLSKPEVTLQIRVPNDPTQMAWNFYGQIVSLKVDVMANMKQVKADLSRIHLNGMPANKIQLKDPGGGFFNNNNATLAALNLGPSATLELVPKTRGGRR